jgi:hypothetical protein
VRKNNPLDLPEETLNALKRFVGPQPLMVLLNYHQGVPVISEAFLQSFDLKTATLRTHPPQLACLALERQTQLQSRLLSLAMQARVAALDVAGGRVQLNEFQSVPYITERRLAVRPQPPRSLEVDLFGPDWTAHSRLDLLSLSNLEVYLPAAEIFFEPEVVFREGASLRARLRLPGADRPIELTGTVLRGAPEKDDYTVSIKAAANNEAQPAIRNYILQRRAAVTQELQARYEQMARPAPNTDGV